MNFKSCNRVRIRTLLYIALIPFLLLMSSSGLLTSLAAATTTTTTTSVSESTPEYSSWQQQVTNLPTPSTGCFIATYPDIDWVPGGDHCVAPPPGYQNVGAGNDWQAEITSGHIGESQGEVSSMSGVTSEADDSLGANYYTIQDNSNTFSTTYSGNSATGWEQFIFENWPGDNASFVFIEYWLIGYYTTYGSCPSQQTGLTAWADVSGNCTSKTNTSYQLSLQSPTSLTSYELKGYADNSGNDESVFCNSTSCYAESAGYTVLDLAAGWTYAEWNVLGYEDGSTACINGSGDPCSGPSGSPSITIRDSLYSGGTNVLASCSSSQANTAEQNDLTLGGTCSSQDFSPYYIYFTMT